MTLWGSKAMKAGASRPGWAWRPRRLAPLAPALVAALMLASAGAAQDADDGASNAGNARQAIEITADTLEVRQSENVAIFEGDVKAVQGEMVLDADMLTVYYRDVEGGQGNLGVARIDAQGNVVVSSPDETAQGQSGVYDVENGRIDLAGGVVLNRGNNIVRGEMLTMDLESGVSRVSGGSSRVQGLFVPEDRGE